MELQIKVAQAVHVLNHDSLSCNRVAANQWLIQFQQTNAAWEVATLILTYSDQLRLHCQASPLFFDFEVEFFAAQILKRKIQNEGYHLQAAAKEALLSSLLLAAKRFSSGPPQLLTQVCLALSALLLRAADHKKPIEQLFYSLQTLQSEDSGNIAVPEMLTVLPEEIIEDHSTDSSLTLARRAPFTYPDGSGIPTATVREKVRRFESAARKKSKNTALLTELGTGWMLHGDFSWFIASHPLLNFVFNSLQVTASFDLAIEVLAELLSHHEELPQVLLSRVQYIKRCFTIASSD